MENQGLDRQVTFPEALQLVGYRNSAQSRPPDFERQTSFLPDPIDNTIPATCHPSHWCWGWTSSSVTSTCTAMSPRNRKARKAPLLAQTGALSRNRSPGPSVAAHAPQQRISVTETASFLTKPLEPQCLHPERGNDNSTYYRAVVWPKGAAMSEVIRLQCLVHGQYYGGAR